MGLNLRWNLDDLYTSFESENFIKELNGLKDYIIKINNLAETLANYSELESIEKFIKLKNEFAKYSMLLSYANFIESVDSDNDKAGKYIDIIENILTDLTKSDVLFTQYMSGVENLDKLINSSKLLKEHEFYLKEVKLNSKYVLSEKEETIISKMQTTGSNAFASMKEQLFANLSAEVQRNGVKETLPLTAIRNLAYSSDKNLRKSAYEAEIEAYGKIERAVAFALNGVKGEVLTTCKLKGYSSPLEMTLISSRMERKTLDAMFEAIAEYKPHFIRYFRKKAEMLGHKNGLPFYDLFAPIGKSELTFTYDEAADFINKHFSSFSSKLGVYSKKAFESGWIDAEMRKGKRGGAYCENLNYIKQSRIMSNFSGSFSSVSTLSHELGHGYHGDCINSETNINTEYTMPIAETASTFCETIITNAALKTANKEETLSILENDISGAAQTIIDITSRFIFEDNVFNKRKDGPLSVTEIKELMINAQKEAYGDGLDHNVLHPYMWICKPHYYYAQTNYYNFPYAYGQLFSKGLYSIYLEKGEEFVRQYDNLLAATGKNSMESIGRIAGIDVTDKKFWRSSLEQYKIMIDKFCEM